MCREGSDAEPGANPAVRPLFLSTLECGPYLRGGRLPAAVAPREGGAPGPYSETGSRPFSSGPLRFPSSQREPAQPLAMPPKRPPHPRCLCVSWAPCAANTGSHHTRPLPLHGHPGPRQATSACAPSRARGSAAAPARAPSRTLDLSVARARAPPLLPSSTADAARAPSLLLDPSSSNAKSVWWPLNSCV
ncbi:hypothetical protein NDU88_006614 [Pleurodeles waltl]|uniref:Uncharacterized protein n=1 Tax=Pleurodeles waltl TaxID=8319 RepID=A0AAV7SQA4_PLEWA|nr:hypothetical protein NDU88_006614 [Pleurodeles waltl]